MNTQEATTACRRFWARAPVSFGVSAISFFGTVIYLIGGWRPLQWLGLQSGDMSALLHWYRFVTHVFLQASAFHWVWNSALLVLVGMVIEKRIARLYIVSMIVASSVLGGVLFCIFSRPDSIAMGMGFVLNSYIGCLFACYLADKKHFQKPERILTAVLIILKLVHLGVGLAWLTHGMNMNLLKWIVLLVAFLTSWRTYRLIEIRKANNGLQFISAPLSH